MWRMPAGYYLLATSILPQRGWRAAAGASLCCGFYNLRCSLSQAPRRWLLFSVKKRLHSQICNKLDRARGVYFDEGRRVASCRGVRRGKRRGRRYFAGHGWFVRRRGSGGINGLARLLIGQVEGRRRGGRRRATGTERRFALGSRGSRGSRSNRGRCLGVDGSRRQGGCSGWPRRRWPEAHRLRQRRTGRRAGRRRCGSLLLASSALRSAAARRDRVSWADAWPLTDNSTAGARARVRGADRRRDAAGRRGRG
jgi:hypothetical protein